MDQSHKAILSLALKTALPGVPQTALTSAAKDILGSEAPADLKSLYEQGSRALLARYVALRSITVPTPAQLGIFRGRGSDNAYNAGVNSWADSIEQRVFGGAQPQLVPSH